MIRYTYAQVGLVVAAALLGPASSGALDWPQWRGPNRDGISIETGWATNWPNEGPPRLWKASVGIGYSSVAVSEGQVFTIGNTDDKDTVYCLNSTNGQPSWTHTYACKAKDPQGYHGPRSTPTVDGKFVYTLSRHGHLFALDRVGGKVAWSKNLVEEYKAKIPEWGLAGSPLVDGRFLIVEAGGRGAAVIAFDKTDGKELWKAGNDGAGYSSPISYALGEGRQVAVFHASALVGRDLKEGKELWRFPWSTDFKVNAATPVISGSKIFISSGYGSGSALLDIAHPPPRVLWRNPKMRNHFASSVIYANHIYGFDEQNLACLGLEDGRVKWTESRYGKGSLIVVDKFLLILSERGTLALAEADPGRFKEVASAQAMGGRDTWTTAVLANAKVYCRHLQNLFCFDLKPAP